jgi:hypothetical protein
MASRFVVVMLAWATVGAAAKPPLKPAAHRARRYVLRDVRVEGNASDAEKQLLHERVWSTIELIVSENRDELVHAEDVAAALAQHPELTSCFDLRCGFALGELLRADKVLSVGIERSGPADKGDWMVRVWHVDVRALQVGASVDLPCHACSPDDLLGDLSHSLAPALQLQHGPLCTLKVVSRPPGATVGLAGTIVGETPFEHTVAPGKHPLSVEKQGFSRGEDEIDCPRASTQNVVFALTQGGGLVHQELPPPPKRSPALKVVGALLVVAGAGGVAAGAAEL